MDPESKSFIQRHVIDPGRCSSLSVESGPGGLLKARQHWSADTIEMGLMEESNQDVDRPGLQPAAVAALSGHAAAS